MLFKLITCSLLFSGEKNTTTEAVNNQDSTLKMGKEKKGKLQSALKKVFCCFFPMASSKPKGSPDEDVYEPLNGQTGSVPTSLSKETEKVSATEPQKPKKSFFARLKAKKSKKMLPAQPKTAALLGGAAVMLASGLSDDSDEVYLPAAQRTATTLESKRKLQLFSYF